MPNGRPSRIDRRELLTLVLAGSGAVVLGSPPGAAAASAPAMALDAGEVRSALQVEQLVVFVYWQVLAGGTLGPTADALARSILQHELIHVQTLRAELARLRLAPPSPPASVAEADDQLSALHASSALGAVHQERGALNLLYDVEAISIAAYYRALPELSDPGLMQLATEIMGAEAQHASAIGGLLHPGKWDRVVPVASVQGHH